MYRYINVLAKFVKGYNDTVHSTTGMAPSKVTDTDILKIWRKMRTKQSSIRSAAVKLKLGQHVPISKQKLNFAKGANRTTTRKYSEYIKSCAKFRDLYVNSRIC
jgi:hypothetical protein